MRITKSDTGSSLINICNATICHCIMGGSLTRLVGQPRHADLNESILRDSDFSTHASFATSYGSIMYYVLCVIMTERNRCGAAQASRGCGERYNNAAKPILENIRVLGLLQDFIIFYPKDPCGIFCTCLHKIAADVVQVFYIALENKYSNNAHLLHYMVCFQ